MGCGWCTTGSVGFAATVDRATPTPPAGWPDQAVDAARVAALARAERSSWPLSRPTARSTGRPPPDRPGRPSRSPTRSALLGEWSRRLLGAAGRRPRHRHVLAVSEEKHFADLAGTIATQRRVRRPPPLEALALDDDGGFETMRTVAPPVGRGWEYLEGDGWDWEAELAAAAGAAGREAGRALGRGRAATTWSSTPPTCGSPSTSRSATPPSSTGPSATRRPTPGPRSPRPTSWAPRYGSALMHVTGDRTDAHGLATVAIDDEGVEAQSFDLVRDGILVGYQLDRADRRRRRAGPLERLRLRRLARSTSRSSGWPTCRSSRRRARARRPRSSSPGSTGASTSWATRAGRSTCSATTSSSPVSDSSGSATVSWPASSATSPTRPPRPSSGARWRPSAAGRTYLLGGAFNCGKGQPGQVAPVSHGCPSVLVRNVRVLNTRAEAGR